MDSMIGNKFNRFTVVKDTGRKTKNRGRIYLCLCDCGNEKEVAGTKLKNGTKSCGCLKAENLNHERGKDSPQFSGYGEISGGMWNRITSSAKKRKKEFKITIKYAWELFLKQEKKCALSGRVLRLSDTVKDLYNKSITASLDRIDSSKGYVKGNVQWIHKDINYMKWKLKNDQFISLCQEITVFQQTKN
jgi:hypothetical protein